jgi:AraC family transcriptional regulator
MDEVETVRQDGDHGLNYEERLNRVTAYIHDHLDDEIDLNKLADIACLSPYHWHRIYHSMRGETLAETVKRLRLQRAAGYLANTAMTIEEIAAKSGYGNLQSFTRIFSSVYGMPPGRYRQQGSHAQFQSHTSPGSHAMYEIDIKTVPATSAVCVHHTGSYMQIGKAFDTLYGWLATRKLIEPGMRSIGVFYDDTTVVPEARLRSRACVATGRGFAVQPPLEPIQIAGGEYAVLRHTGPYADMKAAYEWLYGRWLVLSGREVGDAPWFEEYLNSPRDTAPTDLLTDIYLPLR